MNEAAKISLPIREFINKYSYHSLIDILDNSHEWELNFDIPKEVIGDIIKSDNRINDECISHIKTLIGYILLCMQGISQDVYKRELKMHRESFEHLKNIYDDNWIREKLKISDYNLNLAIAVKEFTIMFLTMGKNADEKILQIPLWELYDVLSSETDLNENEQDILVFGIYKVLNYKGHGEKRIDVNQKLDTIAKNRLRIIKLDKDLKAQYLTFGK